MKKRYFIIAFLLNFLIWVIASFTDYLALSGWELVDEVFTDFWQTALETAFLIVMASWFCRIVDYFFKDIPFSSWSMIAQCAILLVANFLTSALSGYIYSVIYPEMKLAGTHYLIMFSDALIIYFVTSLYYITAVLNRHRDIKEKNVLQENESLKVKNVSLRSELDKISIQTNNHFIFNSFNTLKGLIRKNPDDAELFVQEMSNMYRRLIRSRDEIVVPVAEELSFTKNYITLIGFRFTGIRFYINEGIADKNFFVVPISIQQLIENAIKHNRHGLEDNLEIRVDYNDEYVYVSNNILPREDSVKGTGTGLRNLSERYSLLSGKSVRIEEAQDRFTVFLPILYLEDLNYESFDN